MAQLRFYGNITQCGLIILAGSHDNGYANPVRSLVTEGKDIVILEGVPLAAELEGLCPVARVEGLLRGEKVKILDNNGVGQVGFGLGGMGGGNAAGAGGGMSSGTSNVGASVMHVRQQPTPSKMSTIARASRETGESSMMDRTPYSTTMVDEGEASEDYTDVSEADEDVEEDGEIEEIDFETFDKALRITPAGKKAVRGGGAINTPSKSGMAAKRGGMVDSGSESIAAERSGHAINLNTPQQQQQQHYATSTFNDKDKILAKKEKKVVGKKGNGASGSGSGTTAAVGTVEAKVTIPTDEKALRYLTPRPCHK